MKMNTPHSNKENHVKITEIGSETIFHLCQFLKNAFSWCMLKVIFVRNGVLKRQLLFFLGMCFKKLLQFFCFFLCPAQFLFSCEAMKKAKRVSHSSKNRPKIQLRTRNFGYFPAEIFGEMFDRRVRECLSNEHVCCLSRTLLAIQKNLFPQMTPSTLFYATLLLNSVAIFKWNSWSAHA